MLVTVQWEKLCFETAIRFECLCLFVIRKTLIDIQQLTMHNRQFQMASADLHGMRKQFSFLRVLVSQQVTWVVKEFDARKYLKRFMQKKKKKKKKKDFCGVLDVLHELKIGSLIWILRLSVSVTYYQGWNYLWDFHEIRCRCYLKNDEQAWFLWESVP